MRTNSMLFFLLAGSCLAAIAQPAFAQVEPTQTASDPAAAVPIDEASTGDIVVTAQKRSESVQRVPVAITVVGAQQLAQQQIISVADLKATSPALEFAPAGQSPGSGGFIRGIGTVITSSTAEPSVGLVVDGVPQGNVPQSSIFDVARVEVLRGPQGTLFGSAVSAGLVNITTNAPKLGEFSGRAEFELGEDGAVGSEYSRRIARLILNAPIGSNAALRLSGHYDSIDDVTYNAAQDKGSDRNDRGIRARFLWQPSNQVTFNLIADYNQINTVNAPFFTFYKTSSPALTAVLQGCGATIGENSFTTCNPFDTLNIIKQWGVSGAMDVTLGRHTLTWTTGYRKQLQRQTSSIDGLPTSSSASPFPNIFYGPTKSYQSFLTQEIRLTSPTNEFLEYVVGGYYSRYEGNLDYVSTLTLGFLPTPVPIQNVTAYDQRPLIDTFAAFGQATAHLTNAIRVLGGLRYTANEVTTRILYNSALYSGMSTVHNLSWKGGVQADLGTHLMAYSTISRGFKGQTYNDDSTLGSQPTYIRPEIPTAIEAGLKGRLAGRISFDINLFRTLIQDYQAQVCAPDALRGIVCAPQNISRLITKGVELGAYGDILPGLNVNAGLIYVDARFPRGFIGTDGSDLGGQQVTYSARWKGVLSGQYEHSIGGGASVYVGADTIYRSRVRFVTAGGDDVTFKPHFITGARFGMKFEDGRYELGLFGRNLFGIREPLNRYNSPIGTNTTTQIVGEQMLRVVGLQGKINF